MKALIHEIRAKVERRQYEYSKNAVDQSIIRDISVAEVEDAIAGRSEVIEDYPQDKYSRLPHPWLHASWPAIACSVQLPAKAAHQDHHSIPA